MTTKKELYGRFHVLSMEAKLIENYDAGAIKVIDGNIEKALKILKQSTFNKLDEYRQKKEYVKPTTQRKLSLNAAKLQQKRLTKLNNR